MTITSDITLEHECQYAVRTLLKRNIYVAYHRQSSFLQTSQSGATSVELHCGTRDTYCSQSGACGQRRQGGKPAKIIS